MSTRLTREQLYDLVWSEPMQRLSKQIGISDVAIAKHCRKLGVPVPERGYWNKLHVGKEVVRAELPPRDLGTINNVEMSGTLTPELRAYITGEPGVASGADDGIEILTARFQKRLGKVPVPRSLAKTHPQVAALLAKDEKLQQKAAESPYLSSFYQARFDSPPERRRLRIINGIFLAAASVGGGGSARGDQAEELYLYIGDAHVSFKLEYPSQSRGRRSSTRRGKD